MECWIEYQTGAGVPVNLKDQIIESLDDSSSTVFVVLIVLY